MWQRSGFLENSIGGVVSLAKRLFARDEQSRQLQRLDHAEFEKIARDIGVSVSELFALASKRVDIQELLKRRLAEIGLSEDLLRECYPKVLSNLDRVCAGCAFTAQCSDDFKQHRPGRSDYCPNTPTLEALRERNESKSMPAHMSLKQPLIGSKRN